MPEAVALNLKEKGNAVVVGNIDKLRESVASMFNEPIQASDDLREPSVDWNRVKLVILIDRTCTATLKGRWEAAAKDHGVPVVCGDDKSNIMKRIEQRFEVLNEEPETHDVATINQNQHQPYHTITSTPPPEPESKLAMPTKLSGLLEEAQKLEQAKEDAENAALKAMERADRLEIEKDSLHDRLVDAQKKIKELEATGPEKIEAEVQKRLRKEVDEQTRELKQQLAGVNNALKEKTKLIERAEERVERAKEEVAKAKQEAEDARKDAEKLKKEKLKELGRRGQLLMAMHIFAHIIPLTDAEEDADLLEEFEKAVQILFKEKKVRLGTEHFLGALSALVKGTK